MNGWRGLGGLLALLLWLHGAVAGAVDARRVELGDPLGLEGYLMTPVSSGIRHPAVVLLHGCGGLLGGDGRIGSRFVQWGDLLVEQGYVVLLVDSFSARNVSEICTQSLKTRKPRAVDRVRDAYAGHAYLSRRDDVDPGRVAVMGWSHGGSTTLFSLRPDNRRRSRFAAAVAFYPGCSTLNDRRPPYRPESPLLLLIGGQDDWTPAAPCQALADATPGMQIVVYPGAYHGFDNPRGRVRVRKDVRNGVNPTSGVTVGPDPVARQDAISRVSAFLAEHLK